MSIFLQNLKVFVSYTHNSLAPVNTSTTVTFNKINEIIITEWLLELVQFPN